MGDEQAVELPEWSRPPFEPGNALAVTHGAYSRALVGPEAEAIRADLLDVAPHLRAPMFATALDGYSYAEAQCRRVRAWVDGMSIEQAATPPKPGTAAPLETLRRWEATALTHRSRLGLDPLSAARLGKDVAQGRQADAATELTRMREEHERAERVRRGEVAGGD